MYRARTRIDWLFVEYSLNAAPCLSTDSNHSIDRIQYSDCMMVSTTTRSEYTVQHGIDIYIYIYGDGVEYLTCKLYTAIFMETNSLRISLLFISMWFRFAVCDEDLE